MTARESLNRRGLAAAIPIWIGIAATLILWIIAIATNEAKPLYGAPIALLLSVFGLACAITILVCPACRGDLWATMSGGRLRVPDKMKTCPHCGYDLDSELEKD